MLILEVTLTVVTNDPIGIGAGCTLRVGRGNLSVQVVVESLEQTFTQVHVTNRVDALGELNRARHLTISVAPVMLDTFQVPLVHKDDNFFAWFALGVYFLEQLLVAFINNDLLEFGEEYVKGLNIPVDLVLVEALLSEGDGANETDLCAIGLQLIGPW